MGIKIGIYILKYQLRVNDTQTYSTWYIYKIISQTYILYIVLLTITLNDSIKPCLIDDYIKFFYYSI